jgi:hypothetical protein
LSGFTVLRLGERSCNIIDLLFFLKTSVNCWTEQFSLKTKQKIRRKICDRLMDSVFDVKYTVRPFGFFSVKTLSLCTPRLVG